MNETLQRLVRRFQRRLMLARGVRAGATAGAGVAAGCLAAAIAQRWGGVPLLGPTAIIGTCAAIAWMVTQALRYPTKGAAALEMDRQLELKETLSSALLAPGTDGFGQCVMADAAGRVKHIRVENLNVGGWGVPAWVAMLLIGGLLPVVYRAPAAPAPVIDAGAAELPATANATAEQTTSPRQDPTPPPAKQDGGGRDELATAGSGEGKDPDGATERPTRSDIAGTSAGGGLAQGDGRATPVPPASSGLRAGTMEDGGGSGGGMADDRATGTQTGGGQASRSGTPAADGTGKAAENHAQGTTAAPNMPSAYRDVLKAYFAR